MSQVAIHIANLGKKYRIGRRESYKALRDVLTDAFAAPFRRFRRLGRAGADAEILWALKNVSCTIAHGEVVGVIGRNGAGKSTLLKILSRITEPTEGFADINGRVGSLLEVGTGFHPELTGRENVYLNGAILGMRKHEIDRKFDEIVAFAEMEQFLETPMKHYSTGMQTRLAFAVAAHLEPEILLVDEVLAVGDVNFQKKCLNKMQDVSRQGRTVLFVSHNMPAVVRLCPRVVMLDHGVIVRDGPSHEVVSAYLDAGSGTTAAREWDESNGFPGSEIAQLRAVRVCADAGQVSDRFDIRQPISIEMEYEVLRPGHVLMPVHHVSNQEGVLLFSAHDLDPEWRRRPRVPGRYVSTVLIPGNLLNEGMHVVSSGLTPSPGRVEFYERDVVSFHVVDSPAMDTARGDWPLPFHGAMRPLFEWTTAFNPSGEQAPAGSWPKREMSGSRVL